MAVWGRGGRSPCPCLLSNPCALGSFTPRPSWKALDQRSELTNSPAASQANVPVWGRWGESGRERQGYGFSRPAEGT